MSSPHAHVFVYGTLRTGGSNHFRMDGAEWIGSGTVRGRIYAIDWYPGLVLDESGDSIQGEVYAVPPDQLRDLDAFEGVSAAEEAGSEYRRVKTTFHPADGGPALDVWVWEWLGATEESRHISSGDWLLHLLE